MKEIMDFAGTPRVDYARALDETNAYLAAREEPATSCDLYAVLAGWAAEGEALLYPMPVMDPARLHDARRIG